MGNEGELDVRRRGIWVTLSLATVIVSATVVGLDAVRASSQGSGAVLTAITPCRLVDTRPEFQVGSRATPIQPAETFVVNAVGQHGNCTIPAGVGALQTNVTALGATSPTFITMWAGGNPRPVVSSLNPVPGQPPTPNAVTVPLSGGGTFSMYSPFGTVDVIVDVVGYFVGHDHDEFLTATQIDAEIDSAIDSALAVQPWHAHGSVESAANPFVAGAAGGTHGWELPNSGGPLISAVFELPPTYVPGSDIAIEIAWAGGAVNEGACAALLRGVSPAGLQIGSPTMELSWEWADGDGSPDLVAEAPAPPSSDGLDAVIQVSTMLVDGAGLRSGDTLSVSFFRFASHPDDTCTDSLYVTSLSAGPATT